MRRYKLNLVRLFAAVPYDKGSRLLSFFYRRKILTRLLCRSRSRVVREFLASIGSTADIDEALHQSLTCSKFIIWRLVALSRAHDKRANQWISIEGGQYIEGAYKKNRRLIIIGSHQGVARVIPQLLSRMGYQLQLLAARDLYGGIELPEQKNLSIQQLQENQFFAKDLFIAQKAINSGKILYIMADGLRGDALLESPVCGRLRGFPKSYAVLALSNDADVIPVFTEIEPSGHIKLVFCAPLNRGTEDMASGDRVSFMVGQYVSRLSAEYMRNPATVQLRHMRKHLGYPAVENGRE